MKVFISWSGELSKKVAELLKDWIPNVIQSAEPWISSEDIEKGEIWFSAIADKINEVSIGIVCLTKDNLSAPWILFEAGGLSKGLTKNRVCILLIDLDPSDLTPPLSQFNATKLIAEDVVKLLKTINVTDKEKKLTEERIQSAFNRWWPDLEREMFAVVKSVGSKNGSPKRSQQEMTEEILQTVRATHNLVQENRLPIGSFPTLLEEVRRNKSPIDRLCDRMAKLALVEKIETASVETIGDDRINVHLLAEPSKALRQEMYNEAMNFHRILNLTYPSK
jgi:hypothetical protein